MDLSWLMMLWVRAPMEDSLLTACMGGDVGIEMRMSSSSRGQYMTSARPLNHIVSSS